MTQRANTTKVATTHKGRKGFKITCDCATHATHGSAAFVPFDVKPNLIHGWVTNANHPAQPMREFHARKGVYAL